MKCIKIAAIASSVTVGVATAFTTVSINNFQTPFSVENGVPILDNTGTPLLGVSYGVGNFSVDNAAVSSGTAEDIRRSFNVFAGGTTGTATPFSTTSTTVPDGMSPQDDSPVYVVFYDGADLASATDFIVFETNGSFGMESAATNSTATTGQLQSADSTLLYGTRLTSNNDGVNAPFNVFTEGVTFGNVPEPSTALLSLVGLAFVARRRR